MKTNVTYFSLNLRRLLGIAVCTLSMVSPFNASAEGGKPDGQGANACHLLYSGGTMSAGGFIQIGGTKYNVGNPDLVQIAGDCAGGPISLIDDGLSLTVSSPNGTSASNTWNFYNFCGGSNNGGAAIDVTDQFSPGTNTFDLTLDNDCGGTVYAPALYLIVTQHVGK